MASDTKGELFRFLLVGLFNTAFGYALFLGALWILGLNEYVSSLLSYIIAVIVSFFLTSRFVFRSDFQTAKFIQFMICFGISMGINQLVLLGFDKTGLARPEIAQIFAMGAYTVTFFALNKWIVFKPASADEA